MFEVKKAKRSRRPLKINLEGLSGSGKTYTALRLAFAMRRAGIGKRIVVADSENESAGLYDGITQDGEKWEYEVCQIPAEVQNPDGYTECYKYLTQQGYDIIIFDSLTHAWHGAMQQVDDYSQRNRGDKFGGWASVTPAQRNMLATLTDSKAHLISTMRVKSEYERVAGNNGKDKIKKVGMKTDQRDGAEYEFDVVVRMDTEDHAAHVEKVRGCTALDGKVGKCPGPEFWKPLFDWWLSAPEEKPRDIDAEFKACAGLPDLQKLWLSLNGDQKTKHVAAKDARKAELMPKAPEGEQSRPPTATLNETNGSGAKATPTDADSISPSALAKLAEKVAAHEEYEYLMLLDDICQTFNGVPLGDLNPTQCLQVYDDFRKRLKAPKLQAAGV
jgi:hypothetical protein